MNLPSYSKALWYRFADLRLVSHLSLPELQQCDEGDSGEALAITVGAEANQSEEFEWLHHWLGGEDATELSLASVGGRNLLRFPELADVLICQSGKVEVMPVRGAGERALRHIVLDQVIPRLLAQRGRLVLHASAATLADGSAIVILGESGRGKSTLAGALAAASGGSVLADDCVLLKTHNGGRPTVIPSYAGMRLWSDSADHLFPHAMAGVPVSEYSDKQRIVVNQDVFFDCKAQSEWPIAAIVSLAETNGADGLNDSAELLTLDALPPAMACMALASNAFQLDITDSKTVFHHLKLAAHVAAQLPVLAARYPRDFELLPQVTREIIERVEILQTFRQETANV